MPYDANAATATKKEYVLKHFPTAKAEYYPDSARWHVFAKTGSGSVFEVIGTGDTAQTAWNNAYKAALNTVSTVSPENFSTTPWVTHTLPDGSTVTMNTQTGMYKTEIPQVKAVNGKKIEVEQYADYVKLSDLAPPPVVKYPAPFLPNAEYHLGDVVKWPDGTLKVAVTSGVSGVLPYTNDDGSVTSGTVTFEESGKVANSVPAITEKYYDKKFLENLKTNLHPFMVSDFPQQVQKEEEDFPEYQPAPKSLSAKANLTDPELTTQIVLASNGLVILRQAFSMKGEFQRKIGLLCKRCRAEKTFYNEKAFHLTLGVLHADVRDFCLAHRHDGSAVPPPFMAPAVVDQPEGYRKFREDEDA